VQNLHFYIFGGAGMGNLKEINPIDEEHGNDDYYVQKNQTGFGVYSITYEKCG
jgi:hypothetical protein